MPNDSDKHPLDEVMMAMDVVDTLRHRDLLVDRELHSDEREQKLIERLRELYASQGIEVPDNILVEGVNALEEDRFSYKSPASSLGVTLAHAYVDRGKWARRLGLGLLVLLFIGGAYYFLVTAPRNRELNQQVVLLNADIKAHSTELDVVQRDIVRLRGKLESFGEGETGRLDATLEQALKDAIRTLDETKGYISSARQLDVDFNIDRENYESESSAVAQRLFRRQQLTSSAKSSLARAENQIGAIAVLRDLPSELVAERDAIVLVAKVEKAREDAEQTYTNGIVALRAGDTIAARSAHTKLKALRQQLVTSYRLKIVSRPDEYSGVWRIPKDNPDAKNYYIVVEAVDADGGVLTLPKLNEENGNIYQVNKWGLRVAESLFQEVGADKQDDGIIQSNVVGNKQAGYLEPEYSIQTSGATITSW